MLTLQGSNYGAAQVAKAKKIMAALISNNRQLENREGCVV